MSTHTYIPHECHREYIQELAEICDNEYYMSALPSVTNKERASRGKQRIEKILEKLKELRQNIKCVACLKEINKHIMLQEEGLKEFE